MRCFKVLVLGVLADSASSSSSVASQTVYTLDAQNPQADVRFGYAMAMRDVKVEGGPPEFKVSVPNASVKSNVTVDMPRCRSNDLEMQSA
jgi:hypothetical protein